MAHTTHPRGQLAARLLLIILGGLTLISCASVYRASNYSIHMIGTALLGDTIHAAQMHFNRIGDSFHGFYTVDLPDYTLERSFDCGVFYYPLQRTFFGGGGKTHSLNFQDEASGTIDAVTSADSLHTILMYDQLDSTPEGHFIGIILDTRLDSFYLKTIKLTGSR